MRVTNQTIVRNSVNHLQGNLQAIENARRDISTGRRIHRVSEDPVAGGQLVRVGSSMRAVEQFRRNISTATGRARTEEDVLGSLTNTLGRAAELGIGQSGAISNSQTRVIAKQEVDELLSYAVGLGNTRYGDEYLFGGNRSGEPPMRVPPTAGASFSALMDASNNPVDPSGSIDVEVEDGKYVTANHNAREIFLDSNALNALRDLSNALGADDPAAIDAATRAVTTASTNIGTLIGEQGARAGQFLTATDSLDSLSLTLESVRSDLRDTAVEKVMVELASRQTQYQAAMAATSRVLGLSLANYL